MTTDTDPEPDPDDWRRNGRSFDAAPRAYAAEVELVGDRDRPQPRPEA